MFPIMSDSEIIILTGPPGAGKSTTARALADSFERSVHLHTDDFWAFIRSGMIQPYLPEADKQNHTVMQVIRDAAFSYGVGGFVVVVDGVVGPWMLEHFRAGSSAVNDVDGAPRLHYVVLRPSRQETLRRAQARKAPALVDEVPVLEMWDQFADLGEFEGHVIDTTTQTSFETVAAVHAAVASGRFVL